MSNRKLEGSIEKDVIVGYIWHAEGESCDECQELDGQVFDTIDDIPDKPHPNCDCYVEEIYQEPDDEKDESEQDCDDSDGGEGDEPCDCVERFEALIEELEGIVSDAENLEGEAQTDVEDVEKMVSDTENMIAEMDETLEFLGEEYGQHLSNCENNIDAIYDEIVIKKQELQNLLTDILNLLDKIKSYLQVLAIFISNFLALQYEAYILREEMDKYRHSVANCQSAQLGEFEEEVATALSDKKELFDQYKNIYSITH
mgnify:CR=1 FL=1